jgi:hypothetical protein
VTILPTEGSARHPVFIIMFKFNPTKDGVWKTLIGF